ncbi:hypothetical protein [Hugenholtzia roseola]|uniref:hypothetical protein n=1 Tax=Hugenholtzia roseola TaxID=1002 RepID=UPI0012B625BD|nr:hypothetical protein [Hugenholtzia roseola]
MKLIPAFAFFSLLLVAFCFGETKAQTGVVDYFRLLSEEDRRGYTLKQKNETTWVAISSLEDELNVIVDRKNGFIEIVDEGTGGGTSTLRVVLYRKADKSAIIGLSFGTFDGVDSFEAKFLTYQNKTWRNVTAQVLPQLSYKDFLKNPAEAEKYRFLETRTPVMLKLPQFGTAANASLGLGYCTDCEMWSDLSDTEKSRCQEFPKKVYKSIELIWDKNAGKYAIGKKN